MCGQAAYYMCGQATAVMLMFVPAVASVDYEPLAGLVLRFDAEDGRVCHNITIISDIECEDPPEEFVSNLALGAVGVQPISLTNNPATIIIEDSSEPECSKILTLFVNTRGSPYKSSP